MNELTVISNYFPPEMGAASNRMFELCAAFQSRGYRVSVVCPLPNYPKGKIFDSYRKKLFCKETVKGITVYRLWILPSKSRNVFIRLLSMVSFSISLGVFFLKKQPDRIIVQSPPILVAATSVFLLHKSERKIVLNVSDLWPSSALELGLLKKGFLYRILLRLESYIYGHASMVLGQSEEIVDHVKRLYPDKDTYLYRNYPVRIEGRAIPVNRETGNIRIVYAGLLGVAQGVKKISVELAEVEGIDFHIYGEGVEKEAIVGLVGTLPKGHIQYKGAFPKGKAADIYSQYDVALVPLARSVYGAVPSKLFELAVNGLPIIYFAGGEGERLVDKYQLGYVVGPGQYKDLKTLISSLEKTQLQRLREHAKSAGEKYFSFEGQFEEFYEVFESL